MTDPGQSLYNRYRPRRFEDLVGQEHVARTLGNALERGTIAHGFLFAGPRGTGKTTTARILARCLNCQAFPAPTATPCGECDSCLRIGRDDWLDVVEVDAASSARRIDEMREWLESVRYAPVASRYRVTIMDEAHQIEKAAASSLLKTLEEPPPQLVVILCTTHPWDILPTIRSRLQTYTLRKPGVANLMTVLERVAQSEGIEASPQALDLVARAADGSYRDALGLLDQIATFGDGTVNVADALDLLGVVGRETLFDLVDLMAQGDAAGAFEVLEATLDGGADPEQLMRGLITHLRYACLLQQGAQAREEWALAPEELDRLHAQANQLSPTQVVRAIDLIGDAQVRIRHGQADPRIQLELVAAKLSRPYLDAGIEGVATRVERLEMGAPSAPPPAAAPAPARPAAAAAPTEQPADIAAEAAPAESPEQATSAPASGPDSEAGQAAPPPPAPPQPASEAIPADREHIGRAWPRILGILEQRSPHLHAFLQGSEVADVADQVVIVAVSGSVAVAMLSRPEERNGMAAVIRDISGQDLTVEFKELPQAAAAAPAGAGATGEDADDDGPVDHEKIIEEIRAAFDAEVIDTENRE
ncbi:MAG: DNA polymerase III subunit gamma/tau [Actinomycetota bacterium]